jgi:GT2 family glycosyltransferase/2-polyprenyl-3-methyl-5-hydroxy-6-metoxy-1,4-benzoquinol methylase/tetratricopeptide (TPR) repeat protein
MRVFEALASGSLLLTNDLRGNGQEELSQDGVYLATYQDAEDLLDKIEFYLRRGDVRERIAAAGRAEVLARHTYQHRMQTILECGEASPLWLAAKSSQSPPLSLQPKSSEDSPHSKNQSANASPHSKARDPIYFEFSRPELLALVPATARKVLDIGCGAGRLGADIKARQAAEVLGIEYEAEPARRAAQRLDRVLTGDVETLEPDFPPGSFDVVICGDVLEHLRDPARLLRRAWHWLEPDGCLVTSIPNVRHHTVIRGLLAGNWSYEPAGLLDQTHLRFFTRREIEKLLFRAHFTVEETHIIPGPGEAGWEKQSESGTVAAGRLHLTGLPSAEVEEFYAYQYLYRCRKAVIPDPGLTSIVIATHNQIDYTRQCLESIRQYTDEPYELIVVDNGSTDGTPEYLQGLGNWVKLISNADNRGFPAAANQGIQAATGRQVLLLNNDCLVTTSWLARLLRVLASDPKIGLVGPTSNCVSGEQQIEVTYDDLSQLDGFAWDWGKAHNRELVETDRLVGFCLLIRRELIEAIGLLDERFGIGCFDDDDYCLRVRKAGYKAVMVRDAFVHHFGGQTFRSIGVEFNALMEHNRQLFQAKWQPMAEVRPARQTTHHSPLTVRAAPGGGLLLALKEIEVSLCMIARNNEHTIGPALESMKPHVDEMIVLDTGSTDRTPEIARALGARVKYFAWCDDFSAARNECQKYARGKWNFTMDSDDVIDEANGRQIRDLIHRKQPDNCLGFSWKIRCPALAEDGSEDFTEVDQVHLYRNLPYLLWDGLIHEQIIGSIHRAAGYYEKTEFFMVHANADHTPEGQARKLERDLRILYKELKLRPGHPFTLFNLGMTCRDAGDHEQAIGFLRKSIHASQRHESQLRKTYAFLVDCCQKLNRLDEAMQVCDQGLRLFADDAELRFQRAGLLHQASRYEEAIRTYQELFAAGGPDYMISRNRGITGWAARQNLAIVYEDAGDLAGAEEQWRLVVQEQPGYLIGWRGLWEIIMRQGRIQDALALAEQLRRMVLPNRPTKLADLKQLGEELIMHSTPDTAALLQHRPPRREPEVSLPFAPRKEAPPSILARSVSERTETSKQTRSASEESRNEPAIAAPPTPSQVPPATHHAPPATQLTTRQTCVLLVPIAHRLDPNCDSALRHLESHGYAVRRLYGQSAIDQARNEMATDALAEGFDELFWIDADLVFEPQAVEQLRAHNLPLVCGIYPKKGPRALACEFLPGTEKIIFGQGGSLLPLAYAACGFMFTRREVYEKIERQLGLPRCNEQFGKVVVPYFQPLVVAEAKGHWSMAEDYSFCHRARQCGFQIVADATIRLWHVGHYGYSWEDAGSDKERYATYHFHVAQPGDPPAEG